MEKAAQGFLKLFASYQSSVWAHISEEVTIESILTDIQSGKYRDSISGLRAFYDQGEYIKYSNHKKRLPAVTFCGSFSEARQKEKLKNYNSLIVLDIDKLSASEFSSAKLALTKDKYVASFWDSPSGVGLKGLVQLEFDFELTPDSIHESHKAAFDLFSKYFKETHSIELDPSGSDITRLCLVSYDENLVLKTDFESYKISIEDIKNNPVKIVTTKRSIVSYKNDRDILYNPKGKNKASHRRSMQSVLRFLKLRNLSITENYDSWYKVGYAVADAFTFDIGEKYFLQLCELDGSKFDKLACQQMLMYCYKNSKSLVSYWTIPYYASIKGYPFKEKKESEVVKTEVDPSETLDKLS